MPQTGMAARGFGILPFPFFFMTTLSKVLLTVAVAGLAGGSIIDFYVTKANPALLAVLPLGAIAFGLFLIAFTLEKEMAKYDKEQSQKTPLLQRNDTPGPRPPPSAAAPQTTAKGK